MKYCLAVIPVMLLAACSNLVAQKQAQIAPTKELANRGEVITMPGQLRTMILKNKSGDFINCSEPGPDVALSDTFKLITAVTNDTSASAGDGTNTTSSSRKSSLNNDLQTSTAALELAGRTQTVLLAREFLFRTCEAAANGWLTTEALISSHNSILNNITALIKTDMDKAATAANLSAVAAAAALDPKALANAAESFGRATRSACMRELESCLGKLGIDDNGRQACRATAENCLK